MTLATELRRALGEIDIYFFDQLHRGQVTEEMRLLDAGCGRGRNLVGLLQHGASVWGVDGDPDAVVATRRLAAEIDPTLAVEERFRVAPVERLPFADASFDVVLSSAVLHFARDDAHWWAMVREMWRVLEPGGLLFARLAATTGQRAGLEALGGRRYVTPDGSERYLVDEDIIVAATRELGGLLADPVKTTVVHGRRSMMTWVVRKPPATA